MTLEIFVKLLIGSIVTILDIVGLYHLFKARKMSKTCEVEDVVVDKYFKTGRLMIILAVLCAIFLISLEVLEVI